MAGAAGGRGLPETPTWAVALVCTVMVLLSVAMEHGLHKLSHLLQKRQKKAVAEALEKIKAELMLMGFISLLLTVGQTPISKLCISQKAGSIMLPCKLPAAGAGSDDDRRRLLWYQDRRSLAGAAGADACAKNGKVALMSANSMHQLHIFIFVLAVFHVLYSVVTMALGRLKMKKWKKWESETTSLEYKFSTDPSRFRFTHQTSFVKRHLGLSSTPGVRWIVAFCRQFFWSVTKVDYLTMRQGFINAHLSQNSKFDFHKYIKRSLEDDFKVVVGISLPLWFVAIFTLFLDMRGVGTLFWISFVPLVILLLIGTKLEMVIMEMAQEIQDRATVIKGPPVVEPNNKFFWFKRPDWILFLIHLTLFQNAFQMAHFVWAQATPGLKKCFHENMGLSIMKVIMGVALQILCSYITFPLYALVTQMGSNMKKTIFEEQTAKALMNWRNVAMQKKKARETEAYMAQMIGDATPSRGSSPVHLLHKTRGRSDDAQSAPTSPRSHEMDIYPVAQIVHPVHRLQDMDTYPVAHPVHRLQDMDTYPVAHPVHGLQDMDTYQVAHPVHRLQPSDRRKSASSSALDTDITDAEFSFSMHR